jgi:uncharacterized protein (DUF2147 family)
MRYLYFLFIAILLSTNTVKADELPDANASVICGKWMSATKDLIVEIYPYKNTFRAKIVWFNGGVSKAKPMETITDINNPDATLRTRKVLGLNVVEGIVYKAKSKTWEGGKIYEVQSGKYWDAAAQIDKSGTLKVKGYWHIKLLGKTLTFTRV